MITLKTPLKLFAAWLALLLAHAGVVDAAAPAVKQPQVDTPRQVLFVGNSYLYYNDSLHNHVRRLALAADPALAKQLQYKSATIGGAPLWHHNIQHLLTPGNLGMKAPFDLVILQGASTDALTQARQARFHQDVLDFSGEIAKRGGKTALYMTHAHVPPSKFAGADMMRQVEAMYIATGNAAGALVIPVGLAFEEAYRRRPGIKLHKEYDGSHPDLLGTYLAACTVYAAVYGKSALGNSYDYFGRVDKDSAAFLQQVADDTVKKFFGR
ncbi:MAG: hypothetical protein FJY56_00595 [Betaproteobacteria bacterium]|nr:hypothetical protein [Betaproteobacteria bacterium]